MRALRSRAAAYLEAGVTIHFRGPAGIGKTALALDLASRRGRPVSLVTGGRELTSADLLGRATGETTREVRDRYVQRVLRTETRSRTEWRDSVLAEAMALGHTLVYDEFTRSAPETNNALLSALEEGLIAFADPSRSRRYLEAHSAFRMILTSNPDDYAGVSRAPDALLDRMVTFELRWPPAAEEAGAVARRTGVAVGDARVIVDLVRDVRARDDAVNPPSLRTAITLARLAAAQGARASAEDPVFVQICMDVLGARFGGGLDTRAALRALILSTAGAGGAA